MDDPCFEDAFKYKTHDICTLNCCLGMTAYGETKYILVSCKCSFTCMKQVYILFQQFPLFFSLTSLSMKRKEGIVGYQNTKLYKNGQHY